MALPKRWKPYSVVGNQIDGTRFICFKVPLKEKLCEKLPENLRFTPDKLVKILKERGQRLEIVIDLTNTCRYYSKEAFLKHDIKYEKIMVEGHRIPSNKEVKSFFSAVEKILGETENEETLIGVHCTHGVNRTGYLICRYMIEKMSLGADEAIKAFSTARGHAIERENFLEDLRLRENGGEGLPESKQTNRGDRTQDFKNRFVRKPKNQKDGGKEVQRYESFQERDQRFYEPEGRFDDRYVGRHNRFQERGDRFYPPDDFYPSFGYRGSSRGDNRGGRGPHKSYRPPPYHRNHPYCRPRSSDNQGELSHDYWHSPYQRPSHSHRHRHRYT